MIKLVSDPTFEKEVGFDVPGAEAPVMAKFVFKTHDRKRVMSLLVISTAIKANIFLRAWELAKLCIRTRGFATAVDMLDEMIESWDGFDLPYSKDALNLLLTRYPGARANIFFAYFTGLSEARQKN